MKTLFFDHLKLLLNTDFLFLSSVWWMEMELDCSSFALGRWSHKIILPGSVPFPAVMRDCLLCALGPPSLCSRLCPQYHHIIRYPGLGAVSTSWPLVRNTVRTEQDLLSSWVTCFRGPWHSGSIDCVAAHGNRARNKNRKQRDQERVSRYWG